MIRIFFIVDIFEDSDENKLIYTELFQEYTTFIGEYFDCRVIFNLTFYCILEGLLDQKLSSRIPVLSCHS